MKPLHKRGQAWYILTWIIFTTLMLVLIFGGITFWIDGLLNPKIETFQLDAALLVQRVAYSPDGLAVTDAFTGRPVPGIVDGAKLADIPRLEERLLELVVFPSDVIAARFTLRTDTEPVIFYYNRLHYNRLTPLLGAEGPGSSIETTIPMSILVRADGVDTPRALEAHVLRFREA